MMMMMMGMGYLKHKKRLLQDLKGVYLNRILQTLLEFGLLDILYSFPPALI